MDTTKTYPWQRWLGSFVLAASVGLSGCSDGKDGAAGAAGPAGSAPIVRSDTPEKAFSSVTSTAIAANGVMTVEFTIEDADGNGFVGLKDIGEVRFIAAQLSAGATYGDASSWHRVAYESSNSRRGTPLAGELVDNGDGSYRYTFATNITEAADYNADLTYRVGVQLDGDLRPSNATFDFVPSGKVATVERNIVSESACNSCHGQLRIHGGRVATDFCVLCHSPDLNPAGFDPQDPDAGEPTADFKVMVHKIHRGANLPSVKAGGIYEIGGHDYSEVVFPQDIRNCAACHDEDNDATPQASNWRLLPTMEACGSCHDDVDFATGAGHGGGALADNAKCTECHTDSVPALSISAKHLDVVTNNAELAKKLTAVPEAVRVNTPAAGDIEVDIRLTLDGVAVTSLDNITGQGGVIGKYKYATDNGAVAINWDNGEGYQVNHQEYDLNDCTPDGPGLFTCGAKPAATPPVAPIVFTGIKAADVITVTTVDLFLCVDGKSTVDDPAGKLINCLPDGSGNPTVDQVPVPPTFAFFNGDGTAAAAGVGYDKIGADIDSCRSCHADNEFHHGATELIQCKTCHNATRDSSRTVGDLKRHVHRLHSGIDDDPLDVADIPQDLFPNKVDNCSACHAEGQFDLPIQQNKRPSIARNGLQIQDPDFPADPTKKINKLVYISPTAVVCGSCHIETRLGYIDPDYPSSGYIDPDLTDAIGVQPLSAAEQVVVRHMIYHGNAVFGATTKEDAADKELCSLCHDIGSFLAVDVVHTQIPVDSGSDQ